MLEIKVREEFRVDNLTQESSWKVIKDKLIKDCKDEDKVVLDFYGVNVVDPWTLTEFCEILKLNNVYFRFTGYNQELLDKMKNKIMMRCIIDGLFSDRVETVFIEPVKKKTKMEIKVEKNGTKLVDKFDIVDDTATIEMFKIYDQICSVDTILSIIYAIDIINKNKGITKFVMKTKMMFIQSNIIELIADKIIELSEQGIRLDLDTDDEELGKTAKLIIYTKLNDTYTTMRKLDEFKKLKKNTPGLCVKYKKSRSLDNFGRFGKGQVVSNRIAVYRGLCIRSVTGVYEMLNDVVINRSGKVLDNSGSPCNLSSIGVVIDSYNNDTFCTHAEWMSNHDGYMEDDEGNEITELNHERIITGLDDIGLNDKFLGRQYHFMKAIQRDETDLKKVIVGISEEGNSISKICTIPERMKIVFNDWEVEVDAMELERAIMETNKIMHR